MSGAQQLREALDRKQRGVVLGKPKVSIPDPIRFATEGTHRASDGEPYTITYEPKAQ